MDNGRSWLGGGVAEHLHTLGWSLRPGGAPDAPAPVDGRDEFTEEILRDRFRAKVRELNPGPDERPWLDEERLDQICDEFDRGTKRSSLIEANQAATELLLKGIEVEGLPRWDGGRRQIVRLVDWERPENNDLLVIIGFRVDAPGGRPVTLDAGLFVNGILLAAVQAPGEYQEPSVEAAIANLRANTEDRPEGAAEGIPSLFRFAQILVATNGEDARLGTITSAPEHYAHWRTTEPAPAERVEQELGRQSRAPLETLTAGVLRPSHLLDLVRNFSVFHQNEGRTIKVVARYQQFRAVHRMVRGLRTGRTRAETGDDDERGGVIWHTQGSGKSFTMAFLVRKLRSLPDLATFKVVVVVDRTDLREQLQESLALAGETPLVAGGVEDARAKLADDVPGIVTVMIQHAKRDEYAAPEGEEERLEDDPLASRVHVREQNPSQRIVLLVDEAHRSQRGWQHARLRRMIPNAARIGFTGTPLLRADKESKTTAGIFGDFIDQYRLRDSEDDGATVPIRYEHRLADAHLIDRVMLDEAYEREIGGSAEERADAQRRWLATRHALESGELIAAKARDMLRHWAGAVLPNGFKAQVVAVSRLATVRYREALLAAREELVAELEAFHRLDRDDPAQADDLPEAAFLRAALPNLPLVRIVDFVPVISVGKTRDEEGKARNDPPEWAAWTAEAAQRDHITRFKERLPAPETLSGAEPSTAPLGEPPGTTRPAVAPADEPESPGMSAPPWANQAPGPIAPHAVHVSGGYDLWAPATPDDNFDRPGTVVGPTAGPWGPGGAAGGGRPPIAFLIVKSMLLTGFDAPVEQVIYLDRPIRDVELLQAIARTNRPARHKDAGLVVDYAGVSRHLDAALNAYDEDDLVGYKEFLISERELPELRDRLEKIKIFLARHGMAEIEELDGDEARARLLAVLADAHLRTTFDDLIDDFLRKLELVLPRPEAGRYERDAERLGLMQFVLRRTFRDTRSGGLDPYRYGAKVRWLLDRHIRVSGIIQRIPPMDIDSPRFAAEVRGITDARQRALHMEHALRRHISRHRAEDPVYYERLSERLDRILERLRHDAERRAQELERLIAEDRQRREASGNGLDPLTERPIHSLLEEHARQQYGLDRRTPAGIGNDRPDIVEVREDVLEIIAEDVQAPHYADTLVLQERLRKRIRAYFVQSDFCGADAATALAERILGVVNANPGRFIR